MKELQMNPETEISNKYKELMNVAIASQIPSTYCVHAHTSYAKGEKATDDEISEAISLAALVRRFSTFLNGISMDPLTFRRDVDEVVAFQKAQSASGKKEAPKQPEKVETSAQAYKEMDHMLGLVPKFFLAYPESGVAGAWKEFKDMQLNPETAIPNKYKELIGLSVAAQIPCQYCVYFHTEVAKLHGATSGEIYEAAAIAGASRHWSASFNGFQRNYEQFEKEFDESLKKSEGKSKGKGQQAYA